MHLKYFTAVIILLAEIKLTLQNCVLLTTNVMEQLRTPYYMGYRGLSVLSKYIHCSNVELSSDLPKNVAPLLTEFGVKWIEFNNSNSPQIATDAFKSLNYLYDVRINNADVHLIQPGAFTALVKLQSLSLKNNKLSEITGEYFNNVSSLIELDLGFNNIGTVSEDSFRSQKYLKRLILENNLITELKPNVFKALSLLEVLDLSFNKITAIDIKLFKDLANLQVLALDNNNLDRFNGELILNCPRLKNLYLEHNHIISVGNMSIKYSLDVLNISHNIVKFLDFSNLSRISTIDLNSNGIISNKGLDFRNLIARNIVFDQNFLGFTSLQDLFNNLSNVESLSLVNNQIRLLNFSSSFRLLNKVKTLNISQNYLSFENITFDLPVSIEVLNLNQNNFNSRLNITNLQNIKVLTMNFNKLTEIPFNFFRNLKSLRKIDLSNNKISKIAIGSFRDLIFIEELDLSFNNISNLELGTFVGLAALFRLNLSNNKLTNLHNDVFHNLKSLQYLNLNHNNVSYSVIDNTIGYMIMLREIGLAENGLSCNQLTLLLKTQRLAQRRMRIMNAGSYEDTNIDGVGCRNEDSNSASLMNLEKDSLQDINSKLTTTNTALILIVLIVLVSNVLLYCALHGKTEYLKKKLWNRQSLQEMRLVDEA